MGMMDELDYKVNFPMKDPLVQQCDISHSYFSKSSFFIHNHEGHHCFKFEPFDCQESGLEDYHCGTCQCEFDTLVLLKKHVTEEHSVEQKKDRSPKYETRTHTCQQCSFQTYSYLHWFKHVSGKCYVSNSQENHVSSEDPHLRNYVEQYLGDKPTKLVNGGKHKPKNSNLEQHFTIQFDKERKKWFKCEECMFKAARICDWKVHFIARHAEDTDKPWLKCERCPFKTLKRSYLEEHFNGRHADDKNKNWFECGQCTFKTPRKRDLRKHSNLQHADDKDKTWFECEQCPYKTQHKSHLKKHFIARHADDKDKAWFKCEQCSYKTLQKSHLKNHFVARHADDKDKIWFQCERCAFKTSQKCDLKKHFMARHEDDKNKKWFQCEQCAFKTLRKSLLREHFMARHVEDENKKWFECELCAYKTIRKGDLKKHLDARHSKNRSPGSRKTVIGSSLT